MYKHCREKQLLIQKVWKNCSRKVRLVKPQPSAAWKAHPTPTRAKFAPARCQRTTFPKNTLTTIDALSGRIYSDQGLQQPFAGRIRRLLITRSVYRAGIS